jgi:hypothetical protein
MIAIIGYAISCVGYAFLLLLLFTVRKSGVAKYLLILATASTCLWSVAPFMFSAMSVQQILFFDNIKNIFWLLFLASCLKDNFTHILDVLSRKETWMIIALPILALMLPYLGVQEASWVFLLQTMIPLQILVLLEIIYRQSGDKRWALKPLVM